MSLVWILKLITLHIEVKGMFLSVFYYCISAFLCPCRFSKPSLCRLSKFQLSYLAVSKPCRLLELYPERASHFSGSGGERGQLSIALTENHISHIKSHAKMPHLCKEFLGDRQANNNFTIPWSVCVHFWQVMRY